jgi:hypothetical protein
MSDFGDLVGEGLKSVATHCGVSRLACGLPLSKALAPTQNGKPNMAADKASQLNGFVEAYGVEPVVERELGTRICIGWYSEARRDLGLAPVAEHGGGLFSKVT